MCLALSRVPGGTVNNSRDQDILKQKTKPNQKDIRSQEWWPTSVIPALGRQRREDEEFKAIFDYRVSSRPTWET